MAAWDPVAAPEVGEVVVGELEIAVMVALVVGVDPAEETAVPAVDSALAEAAPAVVVKEVEEVAEAQLASLILTVLSIHP